MVPLRVRRRLLDRELRDIEALDLRCARDAGIQREGAHVREAVEDALPLTDPLHRPPIILLIEEKSGLLSIHDIDHILDAILRDLDIRVKLRADEALIHVHAFLLSNRRVTPLVDAADVDAVLLEDLHEILQNHRLQTIHAERERLHHQHILIFINRESRQPVRLAENHTAGIRILAHGGLPVVPRRLHAIPQKRRVDRLLPPAAQHPHPDLRVMVDEAIAHEEAVEILHADDIPVRVVTCVLVDFIVENPGTARLDRAALALTQNHLSI